MAAITPVETKEFTVLETEAKQLISNGEITKAEQLYTDFIKQQKDDTKCRKTLAVARNNRGQLRYLKVDFYGAIEDYTEATELDPSFAVSYYNRGQIHYRMGRFKLAIDDLRKAIKLDPNFCDAQDNLRQAEKDFAATNMMDTSVTT